MARPLLRGRGSRVTKFNVGDIIRNPNTGISDYEVLEVEGDRYRLLPAGNSIPLLGTLESQRESWAQGYGAWFGHDIEANYEVVS